MTQPPPNPEPLHSILARIMPSLVEQKREPEPEDDGSTPPPALHPGSVEV